VSFKQLKEDLGIKRKPDLIKWLIDHDVKHWYVGSNKEPVTMKEWMLNSKPDWPKNCAYDNEQEPIL